MNRSRAFHFKQDRADDYCHRYSEAAAWGTSTATGVPGDKVVAQPSQTREETAKYTDLMPDGTARQFTLPELFGEMLLDLNRPEEAQHQFQLALARAPKRAVSVLGVARAAARAGDRTAAQHAYTELRAIWKAAPTQPELQELATVLSRRTFKSGIPK